MRPELFNAVSGVALAVQPLQPSQALTAMQRAAQRVECLANGGGMQQQWTLKDELRQGFYLEPVPLQHFHGQDCRSQSALLSSYFTRIEMENEER